MIGTFKIAFGGWRFLYHAQQVFLAACQLYVIYIGNIEYNEVVDIIGIEVIVHYGQLLGTVTPYKPQLPGGGGVGVIDDVDSLPVFYLVEDIVFDVNLAAIGDAAGVDAFYLFNRIGAGVNGRPAVDRCGNPLPGATCSQKDKWH